MLTGIHFLLTYACNFECDHCFLYCSPQSRGTFTIHQVDRVLAEAAKIGTVKSIFFEGGEPFLFYPLLIESIRRSRAKGFHVGVVTNAYGAHSEEDAALWLAPLAQLGVSSLSISNDAFHYHDPSQNPATVALSVAKKLGLSVSPICIEPPTTLPPSPKEDSKGRPVVGGDAKFRGRAVEKLTWDLPLRPWRELRCCPYEELASPQRVHIDAYGNVHICQGISMGNIWQTPLSELVAAYRADTHPICGPLIEGGPAELATHLGNRPQDAFVDECHFCYLVRRAAIDRFPDFLAPRQVYGFDATAAEK